MDNCCAALFRGHIAVEHALDDAILSLRRNGWGIALAELLYLILAPVHLALFVVTLPFFLIGLPFWAADGLAIERLVQGAWYTPLVGNTLGFFWMGLSFYLCLAKNLFYDAMDYALPHALRQAVRVGD